MLAACFLRFPYKDLAESVGSPLASPFRTPYVSVNSFQFTCRLPGPLHPDDNGMTESFMKPLTVEGICTLAFKNEKDVAERFPRFIGSYDERRPGSALGYPRPDQFEEKHTRAPVKAAA